MAPEHDADGFNLKRAAPSLLGFTLLCNIRKKNSDQSFVWFADSKSVNIEPAIHCRRIVYESSWLARPLNLPINFEPTLFEIWLKLASPLAACIGDAGLLLECGVYF